MKGQFLDLLTNVYVVLKCRIIQFDPNGVTAFLWEVAPVEPVWTSRLPNLTIVWLHTYNFDGERHRLTGGIHNPQLEEGP